MLSNRSSECPGERTKIEPTDPKYAVCPKNRPPKAAEKIEVFRNVYYVVSVKRSYRYNVTDWGRTHIAVERKHMEWRDHHTKLNVAPKGVPHLSSVPHEMHTASFDAPVKLQVTAKCSEVATLSRCAGGFLRCPLSTAARGSVILP